MTTGNQTYKDETEAQLRLDLQEAESHLQAMEEMVVSSKSCAIRALNDRNEAAKKLSDFLTSEQ